MTKSFKHSGAFGDLIYSLALVKHFGGGDFYLHLNQIDWIGYHYYGSKPNPIHQGRLTEQDYEFMHDFILDLPYINKFNILTPDVEITHNLDRFRPMFVGHPGNYVDIYATVFGIRDVGTQTMMRNTAWLEVKNPKRIARTVINRTNRWLPPQLGPAWSESDWAKDAVFIGLANEYTDFVRATGYDIEHYPTQSMLDMAEVIAGADLFIGNQSSALSLAIGLGKDFWCERRTDLPIERNECYFPNHPNGNYFA